MTSVSTDQSDGDLLEGLRRLLADQPPADLPVAILARRPNEYTSSSQSEVVTVSTAAGGRRELLLKHARPLHDQPPICRHGIEYCGEVYRQVVARMPLPRLVAYGLIEPSTSGGACLVMEHLSAALRVGEAPEVSGILAAAEWCGEFHRWGEARHDDPLLAFLVRYDAGSYTAWLPRLERLCEQAALQPSWLTELMATAPMVLERLASEPVTLIHGELSPQNVLWHNGMIVPIDWESAAFGPGVIDLAALLFGWPAETIERCLDAYWVARCRPRPAGFAAVWDAAILYTGLRWVPQPANATDERFHAAIERLGRLRHG